MFVLYRHFLLFVLGCALALPLHAAQRQPDRSGDQPSSADGTPQRKHLAKDLDRLGLQQQVGADSEQQKEIVGDEEIVNDKEAGDDVNPLPPLSPRRLSLPPVKRVKPLSVEKVSISEARAFFAAHYSPQMLSLILDGETLGRKWHAVCEKALQAFLEDVRLKVESKPGSYNNINPLTEIPSVEWENFLKTKMGNLIEGALSEKAREAERRSEAEITRLTTPPVPLSAPPIAPQTPTKVFAVPTRPDNLAGSPVRRRLVVQQPTALVLKDTPVKKLSMSQLRENLLINILAAVFPRGPHGALYKIVSFFLKLKKMDLDAQSIAHELEEQEFFKTHRKFIAFLCRYLTSDILHEVLSLQKTDSSPMMGKKSNTKENIFTTLMRQKVGTIKEYEDILQDEQCFAQLFELGEILKECKALSEPKHKVALQIIILLLNQFSDDMGIHEHPLPLTTVDAFLEYLKITGLLPLAMLSVQKIEYLPEVVERLIETILRYKQAPSEEARISDLVKIAELTVLVSKLSDRCFALLIDPGNRAIVAEIFNIIHEKIAARERALRLGRGEETGSYSKIGVYPRMVRPLLHLAKKIESVVSGIEPIFNEAILVAVKEDHIERVTFDQRLSDRKLQLQGGHFDFPVPYKVQATADSLTTEIVNMDVMCKHERLTNTIVGGSFVDWGINDNDKNSYVVKSGTLFPTCYQAQFYGYLYKLAKFIEAFELHDIPVSSDVRILRAESVQKLAVNDDGGRRVYVIEHVHAFGCGDEQCRYRGHHRDQKMVIKVVVAEEPIVQINQRRICQKLVITAYPLGTRVLTEDALLSLGEETINVMFRDPQWLRRGINCPYLEQKFNEVALKERLFERLVSRSVVKLDGIINQELLDEVVKKFIKPHCYAIFMAHAQNLLAQMSEPFRRKRKAFESKAQRTKKDEADMREFEEKIKALENNIELVKEAKERDTLAGKLDPLIKEFVENGLARILQETLLDNLRLGDECKKISIRELINHILQYVILQRIQERLFGECKECNGKLALYAAGGKRKGWTDYYKQKENTCCLSLAVARLTEKLLNEMQELFGPAWKDLSQQSRPGTPATPRTPSSGDATGTPQTPRPFSSGNMPNLSPDQSPQTSAPDNADVSNDLFKDIRTGKEYIVIDIVDGVSMIIERECVDGFGMIVQQTPNDLTVALDASFIKGQRPASQKDDQQPDAMLLQQGSVGLPAGEKHEGDLTETSPHTQYPISTIAGAQQRAAECGLYGLLHTLIMVGCNGDSTEIQRRVQWLSVRPQALDILKEAIMKERVAEASKIAECMERLRDRGIICTETGTDITVAIQQRKSSVRRLEGALAQRQLNADWLSGNELEFLLKSEVLQQLLIDLCIPQDTVQKVLIYDYHDSHQVEVPAVMQSMRKFAAGQAQGIVLHTREGNHWIGVCLVPGQQVPAQVMDSRMNSDIIPLALCELVNRYHHAVSGIPSTAGAATTAAAASSTSRTQPQIQLNGDPLSDAQRQQRISEVAKRRHQQEEAERKVQHILDERLLHEAQEPNDDEEMRS